MSDAQVIYIDAVVLIDIISKTQAHLLTSRYIMDRVATDELRIAASQYLRVEVRSLRDVATPDSIRAIDEFLSDDAFDFVSLDAAIARKAREIANVHRVKNADAVHLATALETYCQFFITRDGDRQSDSKSKLLKLDRQLRGRGGVLQIVTPTRFREQSGELF